MSKHLILLLFPLFASLASGQAFDVDLGFWSASAKGDIEVGGNLSTDVDLSDDLGIDKEWVPGATVVFGSGLLQLGASVLQFDLGGSEEVSRTFSFGGFSFDASADADSSLELLLAKGFGRLHFGNDEFAVNLDAGGVYADIDAKVSALGLAATSAKTKVVLPYLGAEAVIRPMERVSLRAALRVSDWEYDDIQATWSELEIGAHWQALPPLTIGGGYRRLAIELDAPDEDISGELIFSGPVIYAGLEW